MIKVDLVEQAKLPSMTQAMNDREKLLTGKEPDTPNGLDITAFGIAEPISEGGTKNIMLKPFNPRVPRVGRSAVVSLITNNGLLQGVLGVFREKTRGLDVFGGASGDGKCYNYYVPIRHAKSLLVRNGFFMCDYGWCFTNMFMGSPMFNVPNHFWDRMLYGITPVFDMGQLGKIPMVNLSIVSRILAAGHLFMFPEQVSDFYRYFKSLEQPEEKNKGIIANGVYPWVTNNSPILGSTIGLSLMSLLDRFEATGEVPLPVIIQIPKIEYLSFEFYYNEYARFEEYRDSLTSILLAKGKSGVAFLRCCGFYMYNGLYSSFTQAELDNIAARIKNYNEAVIRSYNK